MPTPQDCPLASGTDGELEGQSLPRDAALCLPQFLGKALSNTFPVHVELQGHIVDPVSLWGGVSRAQGEVPPGNSLAVCM